MSADDARADPSGYYSGVEHDQFWRGVKWQASRPFTEEDVEAAARAIDPSSWQLADDPRYDHLPPENPGYAKIVVTRRSLEQARAALDAVTARRTKGGNRD